MSVRAVRHAADTMWRKGGVCTHTCGCTPPPRHMPPIDAIVVCAALRWDVRNGRCRSAKGAYNMGERRHWATPGPVHAPNPDVVGPPPAAWVHHPQPTSSVCASMACLRIYSCVLNAGSWLTGSEKGGRRGQKGYLWRRPGQCNAERRQVCRSSSPRPVRAAPWQNSCLTLEFALTAHCRLKRGPSVCSPAASLLASPDLARSALCLTVKA